MVFGENGYWKNGNLEELIFEKWIFQIMQIWKNENQEKYKFGKMKIWKYANLEKCTFGKMQI